MTPSDLSPLPATACPLCGQPNACVPAASGSFDQPCWCASVKMSAEVLARIPPAARGRACLCQACASGQGPAA